MEGEFGCRRGTQWVGWETSHERWENLFYEQQMAGGLEKWKKDDWRKDFGEIKTKEKEG